MSPTGACPAQRSSCRLLVPPLSRSPAGGHTPWPKHSPVLIDQPPNQGPCSPPDTQHPTTWACQSTQKRLYTTFVHLTKTLLLISYLCGGYNWTQNHTNPQGACLSHHLKFLPYTVLTRGKQKNVPSLNLLYVCSDCSPV